MKMIYRILLFCAAVGVADAHHSSAMFDSNKQVILRGVVKEAQWTNPHIWIQVLVPNPDGRGAAVEWSIEGNSPNVLVRKGWSSKSVKAGDRVEMVIHPLKDGRRGGQLVSVTIDGHKIGED
jgi:Family of unknown function (DUF6152)